MSDPSTRGGHNSVHTADYPREDLVDIAAEEAVTGSIYLRHIGPPTKSPVSFGVLPPPTRTHLYPTGQHLDRDSAVGVVGEADAEFLV